MMESSAAATANHAPTSRSRRSLEIVAAERERQKSLHALESRLRAERAGDVIRSIEDEDRHATERRAADAREAARRSLEKRYRRYREWRASLARSGASQAVVIRGWAGVATAAEDTGGGGDA